MTNLINIQYVGEIYIYIEREREKERDCVSQC